MFELFIYIEPLIRTLSIFFHMNYLKNTFYRPRYFMAIYVNQLFSTCSNYFVNTCNIHIHLSTYLKCELNIDVTSVYRAKKKFHLT